MVKEVNCQEPSQCILQGMQPYQAPSPAEEQARQRALSADAAAVQVSTAGLASDQSQRGCASWARLDQGLSAHAFLLAWLRLSPQFVVFCICFVWSQCLEPSFEECLCLEMPPVQVTFCLP